MPCGRIPAVFHPTALRLGHTLLAAALIAALESPALAQPGSLDTTFGIDGVAYGAAGSMSRDLALDAQGRIVFVGQQSIDGAPDAALAGRLLPDGTPDESFDRDGTRSIFPVCRTATRSVLDAVDATGSNEVVAAGTACRRGLVVRLRENGTPDRDFGSNGTFTYSADAHSRSSALFGVDVADEGRVVAVGREVREESTGEIRTYLLVIRLTAGGVPDHTFGLNGVVRLRVSDDLLPDSQLNDLVIFPDGRVLATGYVLIAGAYDSVVVRLNPDGTLDPTFENGGLVVHDFGGGVADIANSVLYGPDGAVYIGGTTLRAGTFAYLAARLRFDGTRDPTWGNAGVATIQPVTGASCVARDGVLDNEGRLALAGDCSQSTTDAWALARFLPDGAPDEAFGPGGVVRPPAPGNTQALHGIARQPDGRLVAAGSVVKLGSIVWAVLRIVEAPATGVDAVARNDVDFTVVPNPATTVAMVRVVLDRPADATLTVFDALGRVAARLDLDDVAAGRVERELDIGALAPGVYALQLRAGSLVNTRTLTVR